MVGHGSNHCYQYYVCGNAHRKGREVCPSAMLPKDKVEGFVIDSIKGYILTEENLEELVRLTNEELAHNSSAEKERSQQAKADVEEILNINKADVTDPQLVRCYIDNLRSLLAESCITEQRSFLKSFVERIEVDDSEIKIYYTIPMPPASLPEETVGVIPFVHHG